MAGDGKTVQRRTLVETTTEDPQSGEMTGYKLQTRGEVWGERLERYGLAVKAAIITGAVAFGLGFLVRGYVDSPKTPDTKPKDQVEDRWEPGRPGYPKNMPTYPTPPLLKPIPLEEPQRETQPPQDLVPIIRREQRTQTGERKPINIMDLPPAPPQPTTTPRKKDQARQ